MNTSVLSSPAPRIARGLVAVAQASTLSNVRKCKRKGQEQLQLGEGEDPLLGREGMGRHGGLGNQKAERLGSED